MSLFVGWVTQIISHFNYTMYNNQDHKRVWGKEVHEINSAVLDDELRLTNNGKQQL